MWKLTLSYGILDGANWLCNWEEPIWHLARQGHHKGNGFANPHPHTIKIAIPKTISLIVIGMPSIGCAFQGKDIVLKIIIE